MHPDLRVDERALSDQIALAGSQGELDPCPGLMGFGGITQVVSGGRLQSSSVAGACLDAGMILALNRRADRITGRVLNTCLYHGI